MNYKEYRDATIKDLFDETFEALGTILIIQALALALLLLASVLTSVPIPSDYPLFASALKVISAWCVIASVIAMLKSFVELIKTTMNGRRIVRLAWYYHRRYKAEGQGA